MNAQRRSLSRIVIALDASSPADYALEIVQFVRTDQAAELMGLYIEDTRLLQHAESRLAREIVFSGRERRLERHTLEQQIRAQSTQLRRRFEAAAARLGLPHAFRVARGDMISEWIRSAAQAEALVVGLAAHVGAPAESWLPTVERLARARLPAVLFVRPGWATGRGVVALIAHSAETRAVLRAAARIAMHSHSPLSVILTSQAAREHEQIASELTRLRETEGIDFPESALLAHEDSATITQTADVANARLLVLADGEGASMELIESLLRATRPALLVVREE